MPRYSVYENTQNGHQEKVKDGFNWGAFFFGPLWYLFNNMVARGLGYLLIAIAVGAFTFGLGGVVVWIIAGVTANKDLTNRYLQAGWRLVGHEDKDGFIPASPAH